MSFEIFNRRYTGSKYKLRDWIKNIILTDCIGDSFCDLFAGTGVITDYMFDKYKTYIINDFLYSNEIIYNAFFGNGSYDTKKIKKFMNEILKINVDNLLDNYISKNYGNKFFNKDDAKIIGYIREKIELEKKNFSKKEFDILLTSLLYSSDKCANTVGHYDSYLKNKSEKSNFKFVLIEPKKNTDKNIFIYRENANTLATKIKADIVYIDPPYSSRQYSRFYHVLENIATWKKPKLYGIASKPIPENMSEYSKSTAINEFKDLIYKLKCKYIVLSYNNTYFSKSNSSKNKMILKDIQEILETKGTTVVYEKNHQFFNAGKTDFLNQHKEILFVTKVSEKND